MRSVLLFEPAGEIAEKKGLVISDSAGPGVAM